MAAARPRRRRRQQLRRHDRACSRTPRSRFPSPLDTECRGAGRRKPVRVAGQGPVGAWVKNFGTRSPRRPRGVPRHAAAPPRHRPAPGPPAPSSVPSPAAGRVPPRSAISSVAPSRARRARSTSMSSARSAIGREDRDVIPFDLDEPTVHGGALLGSVFVLEAYGSRDDRTDQRGVSGHEGGRHHRRCAGRPPGPPPRGGCARV